MILVPLTETNVAEILSIKIALAIFFLFFVKFKANAITYCSVIVAKVKYKMTVFVKLNFQSKYF